jgi:hypothetical protein
MPTSRNDLNSVPAQVIILGPGTDIEDGKRIEDDLQLGVACTKKLPAVLPG